MTHILVATDLSPRSDRAVARAFRLAEAHQARLTVLHLIDGDLPERMTLPLVGEAKALLDDFCAIQPGADRVDWTARVQTGDASEDIGVRADRDGAELIVLGLHRRRALLDAFRETTLERLVRNARCPVLLVANPADHDYERAVAAVDASPAASIALHAARRWMPGATIFSFCAVDTDLGPGLVSDPEHIMGETDLREARRILRQWADAGGLPEGIPDPVAVEGTLGPLFLSELTTHSAQLAILGAHAKGSIVHRVLGGFTRDVVRDPPCDVLIGRPA